MSLWVGRVSPHQPPHGDVVDTGRPRRKGVCADGVKRQVVVLIVQAVLAVPDVIKCETDVPAMQKR